MNIDHIKSTLAEYERIEDALYEAAKEYGQFRREAYAAAEKPDGWTQYDNPFSWSEPLDPHSNGYASFKGMESYDEGEESITLEWEDRDRDTISMTLPFEYLALDTEGRREYARNEIERRIASKQQHRENEAAAKERVERDQYEKLRAKFGDQ